MQYLIRSGLLFALLAVGCTARMQGYADTSGPPASGVDPPATSAPATTGADEKKDAANADAKSDAKSAADASEKK